MSKIHYLIRDEWDEHPFESESQLCHYDGDDPRYTYREESVTCNVCKKILSKTGSEPVSSRSDSK